MSAIGDALTRIVLLQAEVIPATKVAKRTALYSQPGMPYWTNRIALTSVEQTGSNQRTFVYTVDMYYHKDAISAGYEGELEIALQDDIETIIIFFEERPVLQQPGTNPAGVNNIAPRGCRVLRASIQTMGSEEAPQLGALIPLEVPILKTITKR